MGDWYNDTLSYWPYGMSNGYKARSMLGLDLGLHAPLNLQQRIFVPGTDIKAEIKKGCLYCDFFK